MFGPCQKYFFFFFNKCIFCLIYLLIDCDRFDTRPGRVAAVWVVQLQIASNMRTITVWARVTIRPRLIPLINERAEMTQRMKRNTNFNQIECIVANKEHNLIIKNNAMHNTRFKQLHKNINVSKLIFILLAFLQWLKFLLKIFQNIFDFTKSFTAIYILVRCRNENRYIDLWW